jgi:hypothetical protein
LIAYKGGEQKIGTAERILAEIISSDVALLITFNHAIDGVIKNNQKVRQNPKALAQLDGYKRSLVNSLTGYLLRFGFEKAAKVETLQDIIEEMDDAETDEKTKLPTQPLQRTARRQSVIRTAKNQRRRRKSNRVVSMGLQSLVPKAEHRSELSPNSASLRRQCAMRV